MAELPEIKVQDETPENGVPESILDDPSDKKEEEEPEDPAAKFRGVGTSFRAKLIGIDDVPESRGDKMCQDSILKLKAAVKVAGIHKRKILVNVSLEGLKITDLLTSELLHQHAVHRISFIARDLTDRRAFGYVYGNDDGTHSFYGIKTAKAAEGLVLTLRDLFNVVYTMKKQEMEQANGEPAITVTQAATVASAAAAAPAANNNNDMVNLQQQVTDMGQMSELDAFNPWPENTPTSPDTPSANSANDIFNMNGNAQPVTKARSGSYGDDLAALSIEAKQPASPPGARLTKDQILAGFGGAPAAAPAFGQPAAANMFGQPAASPFGQPQAAFGQPQAQAAFGQQQAMFGQQQGMFPQQQQPQGNPFGAGFGQAQMFPPAATNPSVPARPGAMSPAAPVLAPMGATQNPFGDSGGGGALLAPVAPASNEPAAPVDPFANLATVGAGGGATVNKKDMFKNFQMAKAPAPPPRTSETVSPSFDDYMRNTVGGVPVDMMQQQPQAAPRVAPPTPAPRVAPAAPVASDPFAGNDPFASFNAPPAAAAPQQQQASNNVELLFG